MNRAERRAGAKMQRSVVQRIHTEKEKRREANRAISFQNKMYLAATVLALHREFDFDTERCLKVLNAITDIVFEADCAEVLMEQALDEVGINIIGSDTEVEV